MTSNAEVSPPGSPQGARPRLLAVGDNVVDVYPERGVMYPGGNAVNVAVHAQRLGAQRGEEAQRRRAAGHREQRVAARLCSADEAGARHARAAATAWVPSPAGPGVSVFELTPDDLAAASTYDVVHTGECSNIEGQLGQLARATSRLSFDFSERPWEYVQQYAPSASVAIWSAPSGDLALAKRQIERLRALGPETAVVTLGAAGAMVLQEDLTYSPAPELEVLDTLGAGDAFIARLLVGLAQREDIRMLLSAATAYGTASCATFGAFGHPSTIDAQFETVPTHLADRIPNETHDS